MSNVDQIFEKKEIRRIVEQSEFHRESVTHFDLDQISNYRELPSRIYEIVNFRHFSLPRRKKFLVPRSVHPRKSVIPLGVSFFLLQTFLRFLIVFFASSIVIFFCTCKKKSQKCAIRVRSTANYTKDRWIDLRSRYLRSLIGRAATQPAGRRRAPSFRFLLSNVSNLAMPRTKWSSDCPPWIERGTIVRTLFYSPCIVAVGEGGIIRRFCGCCSSLEASISSVNN